jgi:putative Holliday junction resolvase
MPNLNPPQIFLAFDFGMRKIGVAVGQAITQTANPLTILKVRDGIPEWHEIQQLIIDWNAQAFVVGLPVNLDGSEQEITRATRKFANRLQAHFNLPTYLIDERFTSKEAKSQLRDSSRNHNELVDSYAATLILESWFRQSSAQQDFNL